jgi:cytoskeletal protein RodZ
MADEKASQTDEETVTDAVEAEAVEIIDEVAGEVDREIKNKGTKAEKKKRDRKEKLLFRALMVCVFLLAVLSLCLGFFSGQSGEGKQRDHHDGIPAEDSGCQRAFHL